LKVREPAVTESGPIKPSGPTVFISYRRGENAPHAAFLEASLSALLGAGAVFRDQTTIALGDAYPAQIEQAVRSAAVVLVVIGPGWPALRDEKSGERGLDQSRDYVRREIELALEWHRKIVPVLVDGAKAPGPDDLPKSISALSKAQAVDLPWHTEIREIARAVSIEAQRLANEIKVPLGGTTSANAVVRAMEVSLHSQGRRVRLDAAELSATLDRLSDFKRIGNSFLMADLI